MQAPVVTTGGRVRGFNPYDGSLKSASFHSIKTTGDGSVGIQVSKPMGSLTVHHDVVTTGGEGTSLVTIGGALRTEGPNVVTLEVADGATIANLMVGGGIEATGAGSHPTGIQGNVPSRNGLLGSGRLTTRLPRLSSLSGREQRAQQCPLTPRCGCAWTRRRLSMSCRPVRWRRCGRLDAGRSCYQLL